ncbi:MAG: tRNA (N(6)-L-threonylcarbamoyladenosine(37)-C(2))-methylthiotransferase MtaB, partial [Alloprevotella sp.]
RIKTVMPDAFIGVDVIVGTRGEQAAYFEEAYRFIEGLDISQLHVFSYSERPGTKALEIPHVVSPQEKHERSHRLLELSETKRKQFYDKYRGSVRPVLWEHAREGQPMQGFTDNYIRVTAAEGLPARDNEISRTQLGEFTADGATLLGQNPLSASL